MSRVLGVIRGVIVVKLLSPSDYGLLTAIVLAAFYLQLLDCGVGWGTVRQIPWLDGLNKETDVIHLQRQVLGWEVGVGCVAGLMVVCYLWLVPPATSTAHLVAWCFLPLYVLMDLLRNAMQTYLQGRRRFDQLRWSMLVHAVMDVLLTSALTWWWGLPGAVAGISLTAFSVVGYLAWHSRGTTVWRPLRMPWATIWTLAGVGLPINMHPNWRWRVLDTFDCYSPTYQSYHTYPEVFQWFEEAGLEHIQIGEPAVTIRGARPVAQPLESVLHAA